MSIKNIFLVLVGLLGLLGGVYVVGNIVFSHRTPSRTSVDVQEDPQTAIRINVDQEYSDIVKSFNQQDYEQVINLSHKFLRTYPRSHFSANVLFKIAESYYRLGDLPKARIGYQRVVKDFPGSQMAQFAGIKLDLLGKVGTESSMDNFLKLETAENGYQECRDLYKGRDFDRAITGFESFLRKYPNSDLASNAQYWLAECYYAKDDFRKAKREFERVLENYPGSRKTPSANRKILMSGQKLAQQDAELKLKQVYDRLYVMYQKKDYRGAISGFKAFVEKYPTSRFTPNAYYWIAESYYAAADYQDGVYKNTLINLRHAKNYFELVIRKFPANEKAIDARTKVGKVEMITHYVKARKAYLVKDYTEAIKNFKIYLNRFPNTYLAANCRYWAGICYFDQKQYQRAIAELKRVQKDYSKHHKAKDAGSKIEEIRKLLGDTGDETLEEFEDETSALNSVKILFQTRNYPKLVKMGEFFLKSFPNNEDIIDVTFMVGEGYFQQKNYSNAIGYFKKILESNAEQSQEKVIKQRYEKCKQMLAPNSYNGNSADAPQLAASELARGINLCKNGAWDDGLLVFLPLRAKFATNSQESILLYYWMGRSYFEQRQLERAKYYLNRVDADRLDSQDRESFYYCFASACYDLGNMQEAASANQRYLQEFSQSSTHYQEMQEMSTRLSGD